MLCKSKDDSILESFTSPTRAVYESSEAEDSPDLDMKSFGEDEEEGEEKDEDKVSCLRLSILFLYRSSLNKTSLFHLCNQGERQHCFESDVRPNQLVGNSS
jgi:hypothetical protein